MKLPSPLQTKQQIKPLLFILCLLPFLWLSYGLQQDFYPDPLKTLTQQTGIWALRLLLLTLCVTPLRKLTAWHALISLRRLLGLFAFFYALLHVTTWVIFEHDFELGGMWHDVLERPYITVGFLSFIGLLPLALTSNNAMIRYLGGQTWQRLHRLVYPIAIGVILHFWWSVKLDIRDPLLYALLLALLLGLRYRRQSKPPSLV